jgi:hypothetical protein
MPTPTVVVSPLLDLLRDKSFLTALVGGLLSAIVIAYPPAAQYRDALLPVIVALVLGLLGAQTVQRVSADHAEAIKAQANAQVLVAQAQLAAQTARTHSG